MQQMVQPLNGQPMVLGAERFVARLKEHSGLLATLEGRKEAIRRVKEEIDSSSAGAIESDMDEMGAMAVVSAEIVKSMSMTTSFPPSVRRRA